MQVSKWGNSLAVRLPKALVDKLKLKEGDEVEIRTSGKRVLHVERDDAKAHALKTIRSMNWELPADYKFDRDEANAR